MIRTAFLICLFLGFVQCKVVDVHHVEDSNIRITDEYGQGDAEILNLITPYKQQLDAEMNEVIGTSAIELFKGSPESTMGNWFADALKEEADVLSGSIDFAIQNRGGLRINSIAPGPITKGKIYELMPFDNFLVIMETDGTIVRLMMQHIAEDGGWPVSQEVKMKVSHGEVEELTISGQPLIDDQTYRWALPDYIANGGSDCDWLQTEKRINTGVMIRDVIIDHVRKLTNQDESVKSSLDGRITIAKNQ